MCPFLLCGGGLVVCVRLAARSLVTAGARGGPRDLRAVGMFLL